VSASPCRRGLRAAALLCAPNLTLAKLVPLGLCLCLSVPRMSIQLRCFRLLPTWVMLVRAFPFPRCLSGFISVCSSDQQQNLLGSRLLKSTGLSAPTMCALSAVQPELADSGHLRSKAKHMTKTGTS